jgi:hypothetical protein
MNRELMAATVLRLVALLALNGCAVAVPSATPSSSPSTVDAMDLAAVVISADTPPTGMSSDGGRDGQILGRLPLSPRRASQLQSQSGFVTGSYSTFSGPSGFLLTWAVQYASEAEAAGATSIVLDELQSDDGYGWGRGDDAGFGDEGTCLEGDNPQEGGLHETICVWRNGPFVLVVGGDSSDATVQSFAEQMDSRADAILNRGSMNR